MLDIKVNLLDNLTAPIKKDDILGTVKVYSGSELIFETQLYAYEDVESASSFGIINHIISNWA